MNADLLAGVCIGGGVMLIVGFWLGIAFGLKREGDR